MLVEPKFESDEIYFLPIAITYPLSPYFASCGQNELQISVYLTERIRIGWGFCHSAQQCIIPNDASCTWRIGFFFKMSQVMENLLVMSGMHAAMHCDWRC